MGQEETYSLTTITTQDRYVIDIRAASHWEETQAMYWQVTQDDKVIVPLTQIDISYGEMGAFEFTVFEGTNGFGVLARISRREGGQCCPDVMGIYDLSNRTFCFPFARDQQICETLGYHRLLVEQQDLFNLLLVKATKSTLTRLTTGTGYVFYIRVGLLADPSPPTISGEVVKGNEVIFSSSPLLRADHPGSLEFTLIEGDDDLVAIIEQSEPQAAIAIYDLKHRILWTKSRDWEVGRELLERLNKGRSAPLFRLGTSW